MQHFHIITPEGLDAMHIIAGKNGYITVEANTKLILPMQFFADVMGKYQMQEPVIFYSDRVIFNLYVPNLEDGSLLEFLAEAFQDSTVAA